MRRLLNFLADIHKNIDARMEIPPFLTISLLIIYTLISGVFGYLLGVDIFVERDQPFAIIFDTLILRVTILVLYIMSNLLFLYAMIRWFRKEAVPIPVLLSYYAIFTTMVFFVSILLFFLVTLLNYTLGVPENPVFIVFGISLVIIFTMLNLYPGYLFYLAVKHRPMDIFWPLILYIIGIHLITFAMFRLWNTVDMMRMWGI